MKASKKFAGSLQSPAQAGSTSALRARADSDAANTTFRPFKVPEHDGTRRLKADRREDTVKGIWT